MAATAGRPTDTSMRHVHGEMKRIALSYLSGPAAKEQSAEDQIAGLCVTCQHNSNLMSQMTQVLGKTDKDTMRAHIEEQVRHTLTDLTSQSLVAEHGGYQNYMLTGAGWDKRRTLETQRRK